MRLVANVICLNERDYLPHVLKTLRFCDQIVIVDGGSTDGTLPFLRGYRDGGRSCPDSLPEIVLIEEPWQHDYARQRQVALDASPSDAWILKWDCDELASESFIHNIRGVLEAAPGALESYHVRIWHLCQDRFHYAANYPEMHRRLFRKVPTAHWWQPIHEQIEGLSSVSQLPDSMSVLHLAFLDRQRQRRKGEQYAAIPGSGFATWQELVYRPYTATPLPVMYENEPELIAFIEDLCRREP